MSIALKKATYSIGLPDIVLAVLSLAITTISIFSFRSVYPLYFEFAFNPYVFLPLFEVLVHILLLILLFLRQGYFQARVWLSIEIIGGTMLGLGEVMLRLSTNPSQAQFWAHLSVIGLALIPIGFYMFVFHFINNTSKQSDTIVPFIVALSGCIILSLVLGADTLKDIIRFQGFWGYSLPITTAFLLMIIWLGTVIGLSLTKLIKYANATDSHVIKQQIRLIVIGASITLTGALLLDVLPRYFGYNILPIGIVLQIILPVLIIIAIYKYDAFALDLNASANDILDTLTEGVIVTDGSFKILTINQFGTDLLGYPALRLNNKSISRIFDLEDFKRIKNKILHAPQITFPDESLSDIEANILNISGNKISVNVRVSKIMSGGTSYIFAISDVSQLKQYYEAEQKRNLELESTNKAYIDQQRAMVNLLEDSRDLSEQLQQEKLDVENKVALRTSEVQAERTRLEASIDSLDIGFIIIDQSKQTITSNEAISEIIAKKPGGNKLTLQQVAKHLGDTIDLKATIDMSLKKGKPITKTNVQYGEKVLRIFIAPVFDNAGADSMGAVILIEDISEAKAVERSRDEFFSIASHELRTPLTAIRGNTRMIMDYYKEQLADPTLAEMIDDIHDSSIRLITIVNDFLDTSRLEQGKITFNITDFDVADLIKDIAQEFKAGAVNPDLYIKIKVPLKILPAVRADRDRLKQAIINLIGNAFKFTEKGGVIITLKPMGNTMHIMVADTGKGIPLESQNLLFRKFQQASNNILTRDSTRSTGLGLYISKLIMKDMGGKIYLHSSEVDKGSIFAIEIPIAQ